MAEQSFVDESIDRVQEAVRRAENGFQDFQKQLQRRRRSIEKQTQKRVKRLRNELQKNPIVKRAEALRSDAQRQIESNVDNLLDWLPVASRSELRKIDRKLTLLSKKLKTLEKAQATGAKRSTPPQPPTSA